MENKRIKCVTSESKSFLDLVKKAKLGDIHSLEEIIAMFSDDIQYLSQFIMIPREESLQILQTELINIVINKL